MQPSTEPIWRSPIGLLGLSMVSIHSGAAISKSLFTQVSPFGIVSLRLGLGALVFLCLARPRWWTLTWPEYRLLGLFGLATGLMNALLYNAIAYIPIGVAVTLEFVGPLGVALAHSRQRLDLLWVFMAAGGVLLLAPIGDSSLHPLGIVLALLAGACWAAYILLAARVGRASQGSEGLAIAMVVGAVVIVPFGITVDGAALWSPPVLLIGLTVALLSSVLPYTLEMAALRRLPVQIFGVLMSLEPAVAACLGLLILGEQLNLRTVMAIALVSVASAGAAIGPRA